MAWGRKSKEASADAAVATEAAVAAAPAAATDSAMPANAATSTPEAPAGRFARLRGRVGSVFSGLGSLGSQSDAAAWAALEDQLILADAGVETAAALVGQVRAAVAKGADARAELRAALVAALEPARDRGLDVGKPGDGATAPVLVVGVNGVGKTTTVGKLARLLVAEGYAVTLGAADTFRAAAADQLQSWGAKVGVPTVRADADGADPASVAFEAMRSARDGAADVVLIDTAGRLQNKAGLMDQLGKISRVVSKVAEPREVLLVLDATTGQNGLVQARVFAEAVPLTGVVLTKMDGSAKGGIAIAVQRELGVPVKFIGLGEGADDLAPFDVHGFVDGVLGTA